MDMKYLKKFESNDIVFEEDFEEMDEKAILIAELMELEMNDPLVDKLDHTDNMKDFLKIIKEKVYKKLDNVEVEDLKIMKQLSYMEIEKRKIMANHFESVQKVAQLLQEVMKEISEDDELLDKLDL